jgi:hypothetical protein
MLNWMAQTASSVLLASRALHCLLKESGGHFHERDDSNL